MTNATLRQSVRSQQKLTSTFIKTASHQTIEVLGQCGLDCVVIDAELLTVSIAFEDVTLPLHPVTTT